MINSALVIELNFKRVFGSESAFFLEKMVILPPNVGIDFRALKLPIMLPGIKANYCASARDIISAQ